MFEELRNIITETKIPDPLKVSLSVLTRAVGWLAWAFVGIGLLLKIDYFIYWLAFFLLIEGVLFFVLIYILLLTVRYSIVQPPVPESESTDHKDAEPIATRKELDSKLVSDAAIKGIIGNVAFYIFLLVAFIVAKAMGLLDAILKDAGKLLGGSP